MRDRLTLQPKGKRFTDEPQTIITLTKEHTMQYTVAIHDGWLCIKWTCPDFNEPKIVSDYWPCYRPSGCDREWAESLVGKEATTQQFNGGRYSVKTTPGMSGYWVELQLKDGGKTTPIHRTVEPYPCPKVRKGIETEYRNGRWMKYLRSEGWVYA
jgi:hypothetical protein